MHDCQRDSHATSQTAIYANIMQTGRIRVYCCWFWVVLVGFVSGFGWFWVVLGRFGWFWVVPCLVTTIFEYEIIRLKSLSNHHLKVRESTRERVREEDIFD